MAPNKPLPVHGNEKTMNLNTLILTNIQSSPYFKVNLFELKTYHQVIDEIYYKVEHLEPWEKGSRKTAGQTGMCGGVRGVGAGGIVSSAYCLLYKLFTLKLTKKQVVGLITHTDSPYIRGLGFMYIRYTQNPSDLWDWYKPYLDDEEELDVKAGGGHVMQIGEMLRQWLTKLEWYSTLFPRIPVPIQKSIEAKLREYNASHHVTCAPAKPEVTDGHDSKRASPEEYGFGEAERVTKYRESPHHDASSDRKRDTRPSPPFDIAKVMERDRGHSHEERRRSHSRDRTRHRSQDRNREVKRSRSRDKGHRSSKDHHHHRHHRHRHHNSPLEESKRSHSREHHSSKSHDKHKHRQLKEQSHRSRSRERSHRSRSRERSHRSRSRERSHRSRSREHSHRSRSREHSHRSRSHEHSHKSGSREKGHRESSFDRDLRLERERIKNGR